MATSVETQESPVAQTRSGALRGEWHGEIAAFTGIPFAAPPTGELRWKPPQPCAGWAGVRDATGFGVDPMQRMRPKTSRASAMSEDCLQLNIWTPAQPGAKRPVMVWLFGGGFVGGSAVDKPSDAEVFARLGVVSVSINYRVGIFGFLAHPELVSESPHGSAGNYGMLDCVAALEWIRDNIEAFGGDPDRVTLFGVSAGSAVLSLLATSPLATGLFSRLILESPGAFRPLADLETAAVAGGTLGSLETLRRLPADDVLALEPKLIPAMRKLTAPRVLRPICDGWVIPRQESEAYRSGNFAAVPAIIGSNADEGTKLTASWPVDTIDAWRDVLDENFTDWSEEAARLYPVASDGEARRAVADLFGDTQFHFGARELSRSIGAHQANVYRYVFLRRREGMDSGPHHGGEVPYVFGHLNVTGGPSAEESPPAERDREISRAIQQAWVAFAADGRPGSFEGIEWPAAKDGYLRIDDDISIERAWRDEQIDFIDRYLRRSPGN